MKTMMMISVIYGNGDNNDHYKHKDEDDYEEDWW